MGGGGGGGPGWCTCGRVEAGEGATPDTWREKRLAKVMVFPGDGMSLRFVCFCGWRICVVE